MHMKNRAKERREKMRANRAADFKEAEKWDLDFWQSQTPQERLSALVAIRRDVQKIKNSIHPMNRRLQSYLVSERKPGFFVKIKEGENFNRQLPPGCGEL